MRLPSADRGAAPHTNRDDGAIVEIVHEVGAIDASLPGADLISAGLADLEAGRQSVPALLVSIAAPRLAPLGISVPFPLSTPEHRLYELLRAENADDAHSRYNALIRRLVSFERAAECAS